jgi:hypothetical protein
VLGRADRRDVATETLDQLDRRGADRAGRAVDDDVLANFDLRLPDKRERVVRAFSRGCGLIERQVRGQVATGPSSAIALYSACAPHRLSS